MIKYLLKQIKKDAPIYAITFILALLIIPILPKNTPTWAIALGGCICGPSVAICLEKLNDRKRTSQK